MDKLEFKAYRYAHLLYEFGLVTGLVDIRDDSFDHDGFIEHQKEKYIKRHGGIPMIIEIEKAGSAVLVNGKAVTGISNVLPKDEDERVAFKVLTEIFPEGESKAHILYKKFAEQYISELDDGCSKIDISVFYNRYRGEKWQDTKTLLGR